MWLIARLRCSTSVRRQQKHLTLVISMQQFRFASGNSVRCTAASSTCSNSRTAAVSSRTGTTCAQAGPCTEVATASAENVLRRQMLQAAAAIAVSATVLPLEASAASVSQPAGDWSSPGLNAQEGELSLYIGVCVFTFGCL